MKWKPLRVLFVGDEPSSKNVDPAVPFVGTPSYKRLLRWIGELDLDVSRVKIINASDEFAYNTYEVDCIIYLGKNSLKFNPLNTKVPSFNNSPYTMQYINTHAAPRVFEVPHPSPRNRKFNDPSYEKKMLSELKSWLYS